VYDCQLGLLRIGPFNYDPLRGVDLWLEQSDEFILQHLSTSPEVEPPHFVMQVLLEDFSIARRCKYSCRVRILMCLNMYLNYSTFKPALERHPLNFGCGGFQSTRHLHTVNFVCVALSQKEYRDLKFEVL